MCILLNKSYNINQTVILLTYIVTFYILIMKYSHIILILSFICLLKYSHQCSCAPPFPTPLESIKNPAHTFVFIGTVTETRKTGNELFATFTIKSIVKGDKRDKIVVRTPAMTSLCGIEFKKNKDYIVYTLKDGDIFTARSCTRTGLLEYAKDDIKELKITNLGSNMGQCSCPKPIAT
jgi:hypothetical protein